MQPSREQPETAVPSPAAGETSPTEANTVSLILFVFVVVFLAFFSYQLGASHGRQEPNVTVSFPDD